VAYLVQGLAAGEEAQEELEGPDTGDGLLLLEVLMQGWINLCRATFDALESEALYDNRPPRPPDPPA
jgi:hypothetical protein